MCQHIANGFWQEGFDGFTLGEATRKDLGMTFSSRVSSREKEKGWLKHDFHLYLYLYLYNKIAYNPPTFCQTWDFLVNEYGTTH